MSDEPDIAHRLIGSVLLEPYRLEEARRALGTIEPSAFESPRCRAAWRALVALADTGQAKDSAQQTIELAAALLDREAPELCTEDEGWRVWLTKRYLDVTSAAWVQSDAKRLRARSVRRALATIAAEVPAMLDALSEHLPQEVDDVLANVQARVTNLATVAAGEHGAMFGEIGWAVADDLENDQPLEGFESGIGPFDRLAHKLAPSRLYVLGARPGQGKSTVGAQIARSVAQQGGGVIFFSLEMTAEEVAIMHLAALALVDSDLIQRRALTPTQRADIRQAARRWRDLRLDIHDRAHLTLAGLRSHVLRRAHEWGSTPDLVVVDYLQLMSVPNPGKRPRHELVSELSRDLKLLARELNTAVLALAQLGRSAADSPIPQLHHLRESGSIEQDANVVALMALDDQKRELSVYMHKNRHGAPGRFRLAYDGPHRRVLPWGGESVVEEL